MKQDNSDRPLGNAHCVDSEALQQWSAELDEFVTATRRRLDSLAQALAQRGCAEGAEKTEAVAKVTAPPSPATETRGAETTPPTSDPPGDESDPLDLLNAIKHRLAKQMENA